MAAERQIRPELSMGWVDPSVGLGRIGSRFFSFSGFGWVHYSESTTNLEGSY